MSDARTVIAGVSVTVPISPSITQTVRCTPELADAILAALAEAGLEIRKSVDLTKHYSWCCQVDTECNCGGREGSE